jgi:ceramide glucosyltransferase
VLVISDSDMHADRDFLRQIVATLAAPTTGLVTTLYAGLPARNGVIARLGATQITHAFLPGALLARALGRQDCLGATMALRRETLRQIGGFEAVVDHLADDNELGRLVHGLGLDVCLASAVPRTTVGEPNLSALLEHELRWARTIRALVPGQFAASILQYPLFWAVIAVLSTGLALWSLLLFGVAWVLRAAAARAIDRALGLATAAPVWLLPLRDLMSVLVMVASYRSQAVRWGGEQMTARRPTERQGQEQVRRGLVP